MWGLFARCAAPCHGIAEDSLIVENLGIPVAVEVTREPESRDEKEITHTEAVSRRSSYAGLADMVTFDVDEGSEARSSPSSPRSKSGAATDWKQSSTIPLSSVSTTISVTQSTAVSSSSQADAAKGSFSRRPSQDTEASTALLDTPQESENTAEETEGLIIVDADASIMDKARNVFSDVVEVATKAPVFKAELDAPLSEIWALLATLSCRPQVRLIKEFHHGTDVQATHWFEDYSTAALVRQVSYNMPLTGSAALASFVSMPEFSQVSSLCRLSSRSIDGQQEILLQEEITTAGVPLADAFRCLVTMSFKATPEGGSVFKKWVEVRWLKPLSWKQKPLRLPLEMKVAKDAEGSGRCLHRLLAQELANA